MSLSKIFLSTQNILVAIETHFAVVFESKVKCKARDAFGFRSCRDLQTFDDTGIALMLQSRVFSFSVFTDDGKVDVGVPGRKPRQRLADDNRGINIELLSHSDVP